MEVLADARATDVVANLNQVAEKVLGTKFMEPSWNKVRLCPLAHAAPNPLMACIWETAESHAHGFRSLLQKGTPMDSASREDLLSIIVSVYVCHIYIIRLTYLS